MSDHPFDAFIGSEAESSEAVLKAAHDASSARKWEHRVMVRLLTRFGLNGQPALSIAARCHESTGKAGLMFRYFLEAFPSFPVQIVCRKIPYVHETTLPDLVRKFEKTRIFRAFEDAEANLEETDCEIALVFEWLHVWPMCVVHNHYRANEMSELTLLRPFRNLVPPQLMAIQSFDAFASSIQWQP